MWPWSKHQKIRSEFEESLLIHMDSLYNLAYRLTQNKEEASDLVQEASLRGYRFFHKFEQGTNFKAWMLTILRNIYFNQYRKRQREPSTVHFDEFEEFLGAPEITGFEDEIFSEELQKLVDQLPEELRSVIILFYVEELPYKEIAQIMDCPVGTVMSRLFMARQILKKKLTLLAKKAI